MKKAYIIVIFLIVSVIVIQACSKLQPAAPGDDELLDGPVAGLNYEQNKQFLAGDVAFNDDKFTAQTGLGSIFVAASCGSCHAGDGKGDRKSVV